VDGLVTFEELTPGEYYVIAPDTVRAGLAVPKVTIGGEPVEFELALPGVVPKAADETPRPQVMRSENTSVRRPLQPAISLIASLRVPDGIAAPRTVNARADCEGGSASSGIEWTPDATGLVAVKWTLHWRRFRFLVEAPGFLPIVREVVTNGSTPTDLGTLTFEVGETLVAVVVGTDGKPMPHATATIEFPPQSGPIGWRFIEEGGTPVFTQTVVSDADGTFRLSGLPRGHVRIVMHDARFLTFDEIVDVSAGATPSRLVVHFGSILRIRAVDEDGNPATRCGVTVSSNEHSHEIQGETDVEGVFSARLAPGAHRVTTSRRPGYQDPDAGHSDVTLEDSRSQEIRIVIPAK
jgi:hypothetical protein